MDLSFPLFLAINVIIGIFFLMILYAIFHVRKTTPLLAKIFFGIAASTYFMLDFLWSRWFLAIGWESLEQFYEHRYVYDVVLGMIGFYVMVDIRVKDPHNQFIWKGIILGGGANFMTTLLLLDYFVPAMRLNSLGFMFLLNAGVPDWVQWIIFFSKLYGLGGYIAFLIQVAFLVARSRIFSRRSMIFFTIGLLLLADSQIINPLMDVVFNANIETYFLNFIVTYLFVILARLDRMNIKILLHVHVLNIITKEGLTLYSENDGKSDPDLIGAALSGLHSLIQEISKSHNKIRVIDQGDKKLVFAFGKRVFVVVIVDEDSALLDKMLEGLVFRFESAYAVLLENWDGKIDAFNSAGKIVDSVFKISTDEIS